MKNQLIKDSYFGEMGSVYDKFEGCYHLDKDIELESIHTPVILYVESKSERSNSNQQKAFEAIKRDFSKIWIDVGFFLINSEMSINEEQLKKNYRLESITIPVDIKKGKMIWELDLINLKDGFSRIVFGMKDFEPVHYSVEA